MVEATNSTNKKLFRYCSGFLPIVSTALGGSLISHWSPVLGLVVHARDPCTWEAKARQLSIGVPSQSGLGCRRHLRKKRRGALALSEGVCLTTMRPWIQSLLMPKQIKKKF